VIVFACIAPHGDVDLDPSLRSAMEELGRRFEAAAPDVAVVVTPHSVHVGSHFAVVTAARVGEWETDRELAVALLKAPLPILGVSYGGNDPSTAEFPLDWGPRFHSSSCPRSGSSSSRLPETGRSRSICGSAR
jgi:aromatic ring-opening dioxygenase LigB subunit